MHNLLAALLLLSHPANKAEWNPPARYAGAYDGKLIEWRLPRDQVARECARLAKVYFNVEKAQSPQSRGCAFRWNRNGQKTCHIIYIDKPFGLSTPQAVRQHEIGHCNGWPSNHPN